MTYTVPAGRYGDYSTAFIQAYIDAKIAGVLDAAPEALDTLNELAAAIGDDASFLTTMQTANTTLQTNIDNLSTAAATARANLQTLLQDAVDTVQVDVDTNETAAASAVAAEASARATALTNLQTTLQGLIDAVQADVDANELASDNAETALSGRLDTLEADPTTATAVAAVQADVDANETASDAAEAALSGRLDVLEADPTTATALAAVQADVDQNELDSDAADLALSNRLDTLEADPTTQTYVDNAVSALVDLAPATLDTLNELAESIGDDADFIGTMNAANTALSGRLDILEADPTTQTLLDAVQADVDQNETDSDAADAALSGRLDVLEADPTTATAVAAVQSDVDQNEADADAAIALKAPLADPDFTGQVDIDTNARLEFADNLTKLANVLRSTSITVGNNIQLNPAAAGGRVEIEGGLYLRPSDMINASNDSQAAAAGVIVGGVYRSGSILHIRVS